MESIPFERKEVNVGEVFGCEFNKFSRNRVKSNYIGKSNLNAFIIREIEEISDIFTLFGGKFRTLESMFYRNVYGFFQNYALASDIARLVILYAEGGIYLDVDVKLKKTHLTTILKEAKLQHIDAPLGISFGNLNGGRWESNSPVGNSIIAAPAKSTAILTILESSNKRFDFTVKPTYKSADEIRASSSKQTHPVNLLFPTKQIKLLNLANPSEPVTQMKRNHNWNINDEPYRQCPNGVKDTWVASRAIPEHRFDIACGNTRPQIYKEYLEDNDTGRLPVSQIPSINFRFEKNNESYFEKVDASGKWRKPEIFREKNRTIHHHVDAEFPSKPCLRLEQNELKELLKKLKW
ncbi:hypothetical protein Xbed_01422 [Xenorhabdus beddingii]|uniref:Uncharacterized protein n=1 Tax=Xenorhabdus beddingii TaxID=40578 RepID=A0A1Y2SNJ6_9GAMM|nr:glycosyltransferase [Xenorhabdus beddingii]OTA20617.1 hypothetical protein Xbed_01422 [Xenorhabdus beddingii]